MTESSTWKLLLTFRPGVLEEAMDCPKCMWHPRTEPTRIDHFRASVNEKFGLRLGKNGYVFCLRASVENAYVYVIGCVPRTYTQFCVQVTSKNMHAFSETYQQLWEWSVTSYDQFWQEVFMLSQIKCSQPHKEVKEKLCVED